MQTATVQWVGSNNLWQRVPRGMRLCGFGPGVEQGGRADGIGANGVGDMHGNRYGDYLEKKRQLPEAIEVICSGSGLRSLQQCG